MNRRITVTTFVFVVVVAVMTTYAVWQIDRIDRRQALETSCRLFASMYESGHPREQLNHLAGEEGYTLTVREAGAQDAPGVDGRGAAIARLSDGNELVLRREQALFIFAPRGRYVRFLLIGLIAAAVGFALLVSWTVLKPIRELTRASKAITEGHLDERVASRSRDEFGELTEQFNSMALKLQETIQELNDRSAEVESIINAMRSGLIAVDEQMQVIRINPVARRMFEVHGDPNGKYVLDVTRNAKLENHLAQAMEQGELYTAELPVRVNKENRIVRLYITGLVQDNEAIGALALIEDITELKRLENVRVDFVANVTHELKTPLTSIRGFIETLQAGAIDDRDAAMRFLSIMSIEAERLTRLIDDILSLSALESGRKQDEMHPIPFARYARQICEILHQTAREKNIRLTLDDRSGEALVLASEDRLKQLLINLIDNAIKYTPEDGKVDVSIDVEGDRLLFRVADDGIGIEEEHIPRLFERFYRVDKGRSRSMGGTGLGLAIVKHILVELDGKIDVQSVYGEGTTFIVTLPIAKEDVEEKGDGGD